MYLDTVLNTVFKALLTVYMVVPEGSGDYKNVS